MQQVTYSLTEERRKRKSVHAKEAGQSLGRLKLRGSIGITSGSSHLGVQAVQDGGGRVHGRYMDATWTLHGHCMCGSEVTSAAAATCASN